MSPFGSLRRHAEMHRAETLNEVVVVVIMGIDLGEIGDRLDDREHEERQQGQFRPRLGRAGVEGSAQFLERGDVGFLDIGKMGDAARGLGHVVGDTPAHADDLDGLDRLIGRLCPSPFDGASGGRAMKASRSSWVMRPAGPEPRTKRKSTPASRAFMRTAGEASGFSPAGRGGAACG